MCQKRYVFLTNTCTVTNKLYFTTGIARNPPMSFRVRRHYIKQHTPFLHPATHTEHEETPSVVSVRARRLSYLSHARQALKTPPLVCLCHRREGFAPSSLSRLFSTTKAACPFVEYLYLLLNTYIYISNQSALGWSFTQ